MKLFFENKMNEAKTFGFEFANDYDIYDPDDEDCYSETGFKTAEEARARAEEVRGREYKDRKVRIFTESYIDYDEDLEMDWAAGDLDCDRDRPRVYEFSSAGQAKIALSVARQPGYRDAWRETNKVYLKF